MTTEKPSTLHYQPAVHEAVIAGHQSTLDLQAHHEKLGETDLFIKFIPAGENNGGQFGSIWVVPQWSEGCHTDYYLKSSALDIKNALWDLIKREVVDVYQREPCRGMPEARAARLEAQLMGMDIEEIEQSNPFRTERETKGITVQCSKSESGAYVLQINYCQEPGVITLGTDGRDAEAAVDLVIEAMRAFPSVQEIASRISTAEDIPDSTAAKEAYYQELLRTPLRLHTPKREPGRLTGYTQERIYHNVQNHYSSRSPYLLELRPMFGKTEDGKTDYGSIVGTNVVVKETWGGELTVTSVSVPSVDPEIVEKVAAVVKGCFMQGQSFDSTEITGSRIATELLALEDDIANLLRILKTEILERRAIALITERLQKDHDALSLKEVSEEELPFSLERVINGYQITCHAIDEEESPRRYQVKLKRPNDGGMILYEGNDQRKAEDIFFHTLNLINEETGDFRPISLIRNGIGLHNLSTPLAKTVAETRGECHRGESSQ